MAFGVVVGGSLNRRSGPSEGAQALGQYVDGAYISIENYNADWYKTTFTYSGHSETGYVKKAFVVVPGDTVMVRKADVRVRSGAGTNHSELYRVNSGASGLISDITKNLSDGYGWIKANYGSGVGWIRGDMFNKSASGGGIGGGGSGTGGTSSGGATITYEHCRPIVGGAYCYELEDTSSYIVDILGRDDYVTYSEARNPTFPRHTWVDMSSNPGYALRKNIDVSYTTNMYTDDVFGPVTLKVNANNRFVFHLQHYLNRYLENRNYAKIVVDGVFGTGTKGKVESFQAYRGISADGEVGPTTKQHLIAYVNGQ